MATTTAAHQLLRAPRVGNDLPDECWELILRYRGELINQAYAILADVQEAEDVVQESFCDAFRDRAQLAQVDSIGAWLRAINRANALNRAHKLRRGSEKIERKRRMAPERFATTGGFSMIELREEMAKAVETLPDLHRAVVVMRYWEDLTHEEIARRLNQPAGTVRRVFYEANVKLYDHLKPHLDPQSAQPAPAAEREEKDTP